MMIDALGATLDRVRAETWLIWGTTDPIAPLRTGYLLRARLPNAHLALTAGAHHVPMKERPADFNRLLLPFLAGETVGFAIASSASVADATGHIARCDNAADQVIEGNSDAVQAKSCRNLVVRNVRTRSIELDNCTADLRDVEVRAVAGRPALVASKSRLRMTGGLRKGNAALVTSGSHLDLAGVRLISAGGVSCGRSASPVVASVCTIEAVQGGKRHHLHGHWRVLPGTTLVSQTPPGKTSPEQTL